MRVLAAGFPERVPATTVDRQCGSSQQAVHFAAQGVRAGSYDLVIAGGVESMSRVPMGSSVQGAHGFGVGLEARYPEGLVPQGVSAELIAARWGITRDELDRFGLRSQQLAARARDEGRLDGEIVPIKAANAEGTVVEVATDEGIRSTSLEALGALKPAFYSEEMSRRFPRSAGRPRRRTRPSSPTGLRPSSSPVRPRPRSWGCAPGPGSRPWWSRATIPSTCSPA
jgi:acetyl-CoA acyltransferase